MNKVKLGPQTLLYPMPALLIGADSNGKPDFMTAAWCGIANSDPPMLSVAIRHTRHTLIGIRQNMAFSVNVPSTDLVRETDYCGVTSGARVDKVNVCRFRVFYGKTRAPLIEQCPVNLECRVVHILDLGSHALVIGSIEETHVSEDCLTDGKQDVSKIRPLVFVDEPESQYVAYGKVVAKAFSIGQELREREKSLRKEG